MRFLTSLASRLKSLLGILALVIIALLIWFVLPAVMVGGNDPFGSALTRGGMVAGMFGMAFLYKAKTYFQNRRKNEQLTAEMAGIPKDEGKPAQGEIAELKEKFEAALAMLKNVKTREGGRGSYLYVLPWYVMIGPPGAGKTTALMNSELHFPLQDSVGASIKGVGGTRNCDWWFTDEAVLLDTAGRYTSRDSQSEQDEAEWKGFLGLLGRYRKQKPINGIIISFPVASLLKLQESDLIAHARQIKQRIQELQECFKIRFPIYVCFTKCDLLPGFSEYFDDLDREEREQVWGITYPYKDDEEQDVVPTFITEFRTLQDRVQSRELDRLQVENDLGRRNQIYLFPRSFGLLQDSIVTFLQEVFKSTRFETQPMLRGVYFTSGTQDGTTLDRVVNALGARFGLRAEAQGFRAGKGKGYFIRHLFQKVIFTEAGLAGTNIKHEKRMFIIHMLGYASVFLLALGLAGYWSYGFVENQELVQRANAAVQASNESVTEISRYDQGVLAPAAALDKVRQLPGGYAEQQLDPHAWWHHLGLYQGDKIGQGAVSAYRQLLYNGLFPRLLLQVEQRLHDRQSNADYLYETLRVYSMLTSPQHLKPDSVQKWFKREWEQSLPKGARDREQLERHLQALLEYLPHEPGIEPDAELVEGVRQMLSTLPPARRLYFRLRQGGLGDSELAPFRLVDSVGSQAVYMFRFRNGLPITAEINGFFTREGFKKYFLEKRSELLGRYLTDEWVMGQEYGLESVGVSASKLEIQLESMYLDEYLHTWRNYLDQLDFTTMNSPRETLGILSELASKDSPLVNLLNSVAYHTSEGAFASLPEGVVQDESTSGDDASEGMRDAVSSRPRAQQFSNPVVEYFADLNAQVESDGDKPAPIDGTIRMLDELYVEMKAMDGALNRGRTAFRASSESLGSVSVLQDMDAKASRQPAFLAGLMEKLSQSAKRHTTSDARQYMSRRWENDVIRHCENMIEGRYPFNKRSQREITLGDMTAYFAPGGILDQYFNDVVIDHIDTSRRPWRWNYSQGISLGFSDDVLRHLEVGRLIRDTFYRTGANSPAVSFEIKPVRMDKSILRMSLSIDGEQMGYAHGPVTGRRFVWPGTGRTSGNRSLARLVVVTLEGQESITEQGDWALFRLFDRADVKRLDAERYELTFQLKGRYSVSMEVKAGSVYNPFQLAELRQLRCN